MLYGRLQSTVGALRTLAQTPTTNAALRGLTATVAALQPQLRYLGPYVTVCNYWNYFWTFLAEAQTAPTPEGTALRALLNLTNMTQTDDLNIAGAALPANGQGPDLLGSPEYLHGVSDLPAVTDSGAADCQLGQAGYLYRSTDSPNQSLHIVTAGPLALNYAVGSTFADFVDGKGVGRRARPGPRGGDVHALPRRHRRARRPRRRQPHRPGAHPRPLVHAVRRRGSGVSPLLAGTLVIVVTVLAVYFAFNKGLPFQSQFTIRAAFASANQLVVGSPVRIAGVGVGKVASVRLLNPGGEGALVTMDISSSGLPIHADATAAIRPRTFLEGNFFVDLTSGSPSAAVLPSGGTIPITQTSDPVQLDQVLDALHSSTRVQLQHLLADLSVGLSGDGVKAANQTIAVAGPAYRDTSIVAQALLGEQQHDLSQFIAAAGLDARAASSDPAALQSLVVSFDATAGALASRDTDLQAAIAELPITLRVAIPALEALDRAIPPTEDLSTALQPGVRTALPAIDATIPLVEQLRDLVRPSKLEGLVHDLRGTVPALNQLNLATPDLLSQVRAASSCQDAVIQPWAQSTLPDPQFPASGPVFQEAVKWLPSIAAESRSGDANSQWFRIELTAPNFITPIAGTDAFQMSANPIEGADPPKPSDLPMLREDVPCETQQPPNLATQSSGPPAGQQPIATPTSAAAVRDYVRDAVLGGRLRPAPDRRLPPAGSAARRRHADHRGPAPAAEEPRREPALMARAIRKYARDVALIVGVAIVGIVVGAIILTHEGLRLPFLSSGQFTLDAAFSNAQAITPGQGQTVRVSGVQVGEITGVRLEEGVAIVTMRLDDQYRNLVHEDATILQRPKTALDDEFLELDPGTSSSPLAPAGWTVPVQNTLPQVNVDQLLSSLDSDTREYLQLLIGGVGQGLYNRGHALQADVREVPADPPDLLAVSSAVATRQANLTRLIHSLNLLSTAIAARGPQLEQLIRSSSQVFGALGSQATNIQQSVGELPGTLQQTTQTLGVVRTFAGVLAPTALALIPAAHSLVGTNAALIPFARLTTPVLRQQIRPFVIDARPVVRSLEPASRTLAAATPDLTGSFVVLNHLFNLLAYNQSGPGDSVSDPSRQEGFLFWLAWLDHNTASVFGDADANGTMRRLTESADCQTIKSEVLGATQSLTQSNEFLTGLVDLLLPGGICGS